MSVRIQFTLGGCRAGQGWREMGYSQGCRSPIVALPGRPNRQATCRSHYQGACRVRCVFWLPRLATPRTNAPMVVLPGPAEIASIR